MERRTEKMTSVCRRKLIDFPSTSRARDTRWLDGTKEPLLEVQGRFSREWESGWTRLAPGVKASWDSRTSSDPLYRWDRASVISGL